MKILIAFSSSWIKEYILKPMITRWPYTLVMIACIVALFLVEKYKDFINTAPMPFINYLAEFLTKYSNIILSCGLLILILCWIYIIAIKIKDRNKDKEN